MQMREGLCPRCGQLLQIPPELAEFSCLYCGARLTPSELAPRRSPEAAPEDYALFREKALHAAVDYPQSMEHMSKPLFFPYFDQYLSENRAAFEALERWCVAHGEDRQTACEQAAQELMGQVEAWFPQQKGWNLRPRRNEITERTKYTIAIFLIPTVRKCAPVSGLAFAEAFRAQWLTHHPGSNFELATFEVLSAGFRKTPFCFVTTAVCERRGLPDDCPMLTDFRAFRDGYLRSVPGGAAEIAAYYDLAPGIVSRIDFCEPRETVYDRLYRDYLLPCHEALRADDPARCHALYRAMMAHLLDACHGNGTF